MLFGMKKRPKIDDEWWSIGVWIQNFLPKESICYQAVKAPRG